MPSTETPPDEPNANQATVTPYDVAGEIDYEKLLDRFGADRLTDAQVRRFPDHPLVRRGVFYAGRDVDRYLAAAEAGERHSIVTGRGPSGPMHLGHVLPFYFAKRLQAATGAHVYVPLSDDEKFLAKDMGLEAIAEYTRDNLRDLLAVGFDPDRTTFLVDTLDADVVYPQAVRTADAITQSTVDATYGDPETIGLSFYPAVQAVHLLLPQLLHGPHPTLVPIAVDQDPHVRVCRDVAAKERFDVRKPGALLGKFLPSLSGPGKMSSSDDEPTVDLSDDRETVREKIDRYAYSGGRESLEAHREHGGDPEVDVAYQYLHAFFEEDDESIKRLAHEYRAGDLLSGELKALAADRIADFLGAHQRRRRALGPLEPELEPYRLDDDERERLAPTTTLG
ncbi:MAG: tryptophanyl-tRNA synthetase [Halobacteriales archaeon]|jgi:tryptophanyl-tRNA synthetase